MKNIEVHVLLFFCNEPKNIGCKLNLQNLNPIKVFHF